MSFQRADACGLDQPKLVPDRPVPYGLHAWRPAWDYAREGYGAATEPWQGAPASAGYVTNCGSAASSKEPSARLAIHQDRVG